MLRKFVVKGHSMEPSYAENDKLIITRPFFLKKGSAVIVKIENHELLKRIAGLPKETVKLGNQQWKLHENEYFVLGDNLHDSSDSRAFGPVGKEQIVGKVLLKY